MLSVIRIEGRPFHLAAYALLRYRAGSRRFAGRASLRCGRASAGARRRSCCCRTAPTGRCAGCATRGPARCSSRQRTSDRAQRSVRSAARLTLRELPGAGCSRSGTGDRARSAISACGSGEGGEAADRLRVRQLRVRRRARRRLGGVRGRDGVLRMAVPGRQARAVSRAARRAGDDRGRRADPARGAALGPGAIRARAGIGHRFRGSARGDVRANSRKRARYATRAHARVHGAYLEEHRRQLQDIGAGAAGGVPDRQPARARARRRRLRLARRRAPSARVAGGNQARLLGERPARDEGLRAGARAGARRSGARASGGLPAGQAGARGGAAVARAPRLLPRRRRTARWTGCTSRARSCSSATARRRSRRWRAT